MKNKLRLGFISGPQDKQVMAFEFSQGYIKVAIKETTAKTKTRIECSARQVSLDSEEELNKTLGALLKDRKWDKAEIHLLIPRRLCTIHYLHLPSQDPEEIAHMVRLQAPRHLPYPSQEIVTYHRLLGQGQPGYSLVLLAIAPEISIMRFIRPFQASGRDPQLVSLSTQGLWSWFQMWAKQNSISTSAALAILHLDASVLEIAVVHQDTLIFSREASLPYKSLAAEDAAGLLREELRRSLLGYRKEQPQRTLSQAILTGIQNLPPGFEGIMQSELGVPLRRQEYLVPSPNTQIVFSPPQLPEGISFLPLLGFLADEKGDKINLLPSGIHRKQAHFKKRKELIHTGSLLLAVCLIFIGIMGKIFVDKGIYLRRLERETDRLQPVVSWLELIKKRCQVVETQLARSASCMEVVSEIYSVTPAGITLNLFDLDVQRGLTLKGTAENRSLIYNFVEALERSKYLREIKIIHATKRRIENTEETDFEIQCTLQSC